MAMSTDTKTKRTSGRPRRRMLERRATPPTRRQRATGRVQATLPGRKRQPPQSGIQKLSTALGKTKGTPLGGVLGVAAGGMAAAAALIRHRRTQDEAESTAPAPSAPVQGDPGDPGDADVVSAEPTVTPGGDHDDSQGPDPAAAA